MSIHTDDRTGCLIGLAICGASALVVLIVIAVVITEISAALR